MNINLPSGLTIFCNGPHELSLDEYGAVHSPVGKGGGSYVSGLGEADRDVVASAAIEAWKRWAETGKP